MHAKPHLNDETSYIAPTREKSLRRCSDEGDDGGYVSLEVLDADDSTWTRGSVSTVADCLRADLQVRY